MTSVQWDSMEFYQPLKTKPSSRNHLYPSLNCNTTQVDYFNWMLPKTTPPVHTSNNVKYWYEGASQDDQYCHTTADPSSIEAAIPLIEETVLSTVMDCYDSAFTNDSLKRPPMYAEIDNQENSAMESDQIEECQNLNINLLLKETAYDIKESAAYSASHLNTVERGCSAGSVTGENQTGAEAALHDTTTKFIPTGLDDQPSLESTDVIELTLESGSRYVGGIVEGESIHRVEVPLTDDNEDFESRPALAGEDGDEAQCNPNQNDNDDTIVVVPEATLHEDDTKSTYDLSDGDYANQSDASSDADERPLTLKRRKRVEGPVSMTSHDTSHYFETASTYSVELSNQYPETEQSMATLQSGDIPVRGFMTLKTFESKVVYCFSFSQELSAEPVETWQRQMSTGSVSSNRERSKKLPLNEQITSRVGRNARFSDEDDELLLKLKGDGFSWDHITKFFPGRSKATLQVRFSTKLKFRLVTSKKTNKRGRSR